MKESDEDEESTASSDYEDESSFYFISKQHSLKLLKRVLQAHTGQKELTIKEFLGFIDLMNKMDLDEIVDENEEGIVKLVIVFFQISKLSK